MTVADLLKLLADAPPDAPVLISGGEDHSYYQAAGGTVATVGAIRVSAVALPPRGLRAGVLYLEWHGRENASPVEEPTLAFVLDHGKSR